MNANKTAKVAVVDEIKAKVQRSNSFVIANYQGLSVQELQDLRKQLKPSGIELRIYKNRLIKRALDELGYQALAKSLVGQNAFAFGYEDDIAPAKLLAKFSKENEKLQLRAGTFENKAIMLDELLKVAALPSHQEALGLLASQLIGALRYVSVGLHLIASKEAKPETTPTPAAN